MPQYIRLHKWKLIFGFSQSNTFLCRFPFYNTIMLNLVVCWKSKLTLYCCSQWISRTITAPLVVLVSKHTVLHMYLIYSIAHMCSYWTASVVLAPVVEYQSILLRGTFSTQTELAKTNEPKKQGCSDCCAHTDHKLLAWSFQTRTTKHKISQKTKKARFNSTNLEVHLATCAWWHEESNCSAITLVKQPATNQAFS